MQKPNKISLSVFAELKASHSLAGFEIPHFHLWKIEVQFSKPLPLKEDRLIDLVFLKTKVDEILLPLQGQYLNEKLSFSPTSENVAEWLGEQIAKALPNEPLQEVGITLCNLEGQASGTARIYW